MKCFNKAPVIFKTTIIFCILFFAACNPSVYRRPSQDFLAASGSLKEAYFLEWELSNKAFIERGDLEDQIAIWAAPKGIDKSYIEPVLEKMSTRRQEDIHEKLRPLREEAFSVLEGYAGVLVSLSSDDQTETIVTELNGMVQDINKVLKTAKAIKKVSTHVEKIESFTGPLAQYVGVLNEIIRMVSNVVRYQAIRQTIIKSDDTVLEMLYLLKTEAVAAKDNARKEIKEAREMLEGYLDKPVFANIHNTHKAAIAKRITTLKAIEDQIIKDDISTAFDAAVKAQGALVKSTVLKDSSVWVVQIRAFKKRVEDTKAAVEAVTSEM
jgi:hypothetical protein